MNHQYSCHNPSKKSNQTKNHRDVKPSNQSKIKNTQSSSLENLDTATSNHSLNFKNDGSSSTENKNSVKNDQLSDLHVDNDSWYENRSFDESSIGFLWGNVNRNFNNNEENLLPDRIFPQDLEDSDNKSRNYADNLISESQGLDYSIRKDSYQIFLNFNYKKNYDQFKIHEDTDESDNESNTEESNLSENFSSDYNQWSNSESTDKIDNELDSKEGKNIQFKDKSFNPRIIAWLWEHKILS